MVCTSLLLVFVSLVGTVAHGDYHHHHDDERSLGKSESEGGMFDDSSTMHRCDTPEPTLEEDEKENAIVAEYIEERNRRRKLGFLSRLHKNDQDIVIDTWVHVVTSKGGRFGQVDQEDIDNQINVMNDAYSGTGFSFRLVGTTCTDNRDWYHLVLWSPEEREMKRALRRGNPATLNIYVTRLRESLGWSTTPRAVRVQRQLDGIVVHRPSLPGGKGNPYNLGATAVHETGHWLGLLHVFHTLVPDLPCEGRGDGVADTPFQANATRGCPLDKNTCPNSPGMDSVANYMDYSDDKCMNEFTLGQIDRMHALWDRHRRLAHTLLKRGGDVEVESLQCLPPPE